MICDTLLSSSRASFSRRLRSSASNLMLRTLSLLLLMDTFYRNRENLSSYILLWYNQGRNGANLPVRPGEYASAQ